MTQELYRFFAVDDLDDRQTVEFWSCHCIFCVSLRRIIFCQLMHLLFDSASAVQWCGFYERTVAVDSIMTACPRLISFFAICHFTRRVSFVKSTVISSTAFLVKFSHLIIIILSGGVWMSTVCTHLKILTATDGWRDGLIERWTDEWTDWLTDWLIGWLNDGWMDRWIIGWMQRCKDAWTNAWIDGLRECWKNW